MSRISELLVIVIQVLWILLTRDIFNVSVDELFQSMWFLSYFPWKGVAANQWLSWNNHLKHFTLPSKTWLSFTEYPCYKWLRICYVCRNYNPILSLFLTSHWVCGNRKTTGFLCGRGTAYPSRSPKFTRFLLGFVLLDLKFSS